MCLELTKHAEQCLFVGGTEAAKKLDELKEASHDRWEKVKDGVGNAFDDLKKAFD